MNLFTGLIEEMGTVIKIERTGRALLLSIAAKKLFAHTKIGDSVSVNGVCLTITKQGNGFMVVDAVPETVKRTALQFLMKGSMVNLERALQLGGRLDGHLVAGHIDDVGQITAVDRDDIAHVITIAANEDLMRYIVEKGSIAVDGVSLTVMTVSSHSFQVSVIPHTATMTTIQHAGPGLKVNLEVDMIGKYVERLLGLSPKIKSNDTHSSGLITEQQLREWGY